LAEIDKFFIKFVTEPFQKINYWQDLVKSY
jgi:hypothetical protein